LAALLAGLLLAALLSALTARILLLLTGFLLAGILLTALLAALTTLAALLTALIWIVRHWKRLLIAGRPRKISTIHSDVSSELAAGTRPRFITNVSQEPMRFRGCK
jgi:hypothetical protein